MFNRRTFLSFEFTNSNISFTTASPQVEKKENDELTSFLWENADLSSPKTYNVESGKVNEISRAPDAFYDACVNLNLINDLSGINNCLKLTNKKLSDNAVFICCVETIDQRRERLFANLIPPVFYPVYFIDFMFNRVFPKLYLTRKAYTRFRMGTRRVLSQPEILGRLIYCGFKIIKIRAINGLTYIVARKDREPIVDRVPADGMLFSMQRVGKSGKPIRIYKLRTMYTFSEYLQKYIYETNNLKSNGKFKDDFRITGWGKILRKYWIDEIPMFMNVLKGEMKLVGMRPLTEHYLSLYNENIAEIRSKIKPGLIPPFYYDLPKTFDEIMKSEERYVNAYLQHPLRTDIKYFTRAVINILFKGARSS